MRDLFGVAAEEPREAARTVSCWGSRMLPHGVGGRLVREVEVRFMRLLDDRGAGAHAAVVQVDRSERSTVKACWISRQ